MDNIIKVLFTSALFLFVILCSNQTASAQYLSTPQVTNAGDITFGAGISNGSSVGHLGNSEFGFTAQLYYGITEEIRGGFDYTYYFIGERELSANEFNINGHYFIRNRDNVIIYALGGLNISRADGDREIWGNVDSRRFGINAGIGLELDFGNFSIFGEPKFTLGGWTQLMMTGGVRYRL